MVQDKIFYHLKWFSISSIQMKSWILFLIY